MSLINVFTQWGVRELIPPLRTRPELYALSNEFERRWRADLIGIIVGSQAGLFITTKEGTSGSFAEIDRLPGVGWAVGVAHEGREVITKSSEPNTQLRIEPWAEIVRVGANDKLERAGGAGFLGRL